MAMATTLANALRLVQKELTQKMNVDASVRYYRLQNFSDLSTTTRYFVEPGGYETLRRNVGAPRQIFQIRCVSERLVTLAEFETAAKECAEFWLEASWKFVKAPRLDYNAFIRSASTFPDALAGFSAETLDAGATAVIGGIEATVVFD